MSCHVTRALNTRAPCGRRDPILESARGVWERPLRSECDRLFGCIGLAKALTDGAVAVARSLEAVAA